MNEWETCISEWADRNTKLQRQLADAQATVEAVQRVRDEFERERDQLHAALMEAKAALDAEREKVRDGETAYKKLSEQWNAVDLKLSQLQALVRALPVVSEVTSDAVVNLVQQYSFHAWILRALQLRATMDATTPAPDMSIVGKCEPPSQYNQDAQVRSDIS